VLDSSYLRTLHGGLSEPAVHLALTEVEKAMEEECEQWERLAGEFAESENFYQAANQYKQAAGCYLDQVIEMTRKAAEYYHMYAEEKVSAEDSRAAATGYFEAATQYKQVSEFDTALTLFEHAAEYALKEDLTETAAQAYLWAAFACHKLGNTEYFLTCAENMGNLYDKAAENAVEEGKPQSAVIDLSLAAMGFATIEKTKDAKDRVEKARRAIEKTRGEWLETLVSFVEALTENNLDDADDHLKAFKGQDTIQELMGACLNILQENQKKDRRGK
jgi:tetratricopeptide (TPR) repeat protein